MGNIISYGGSKPTLYNISPTWIDGHEGIFRTWSILRPLIFCNSRAKQEIHPVFSAVRGHLSQLKADQEYHCLERT